MDVFQLTCWSRANVQFKRQGSWERRRASKRHPVLVSSSWGTQLWGGETWILFPGLFLVCYPMTVDGKMQIPSREQDPGFPFLCLKGRRYPHNQGLLKSGHEDSFLGDGRCRFVSSWADRVQNLGLLLSWRAPQTPDNYKMWTSPPTSTLARFLSERSWGCCTSSWTQYCQGRPDIHWAQLPGWSPAELWATLSTVLSHS